MLSHCPKSSSKAVVSSTLSQRRSNDTSVSLLGVKHLADKSQAESSLCAEKEYPPLRSAPVQESATAVMSARSCCDLAFFDDQAESKRKMELS